MNIAEARAFAQACREHSNGVPDPFSQKAFKKTADIIGALLAELSSAGVINNDGVINRKVINISVVNKEKGKGKENFPPAPPIEKRESPRESSNSSRARARARENDSADTDDGTRIRQSQGHTPALRRLLARCDGNTQQPSVV